MKIIFYVDSIRVFNVKSIASQRSNFSLSISRIRILQINDTNRKEGKLLVSVGREENKKEKTPWRVQELKLFVFGKC